jgi:GNAT superfamily N-acetyltransferase
MTIRIDFSPMIRHPPIRVAYLADHPNLLDQVASWHYDEWDRDTLGLSQQEVRKLIGSKALNRNRLNINFVALLPDGTPIGTIQLMAHEYLPNWMDVGPWIGALYVTPAWRHGGAAYALGYVAMRKALEIGFEHLYAFTSNLHQTLLRHHFDAIATQDFGGVPHTIYRKELL